MGVVRLSTSGSQPDGSEPDGRCLARRGVWCLAALDAERVIGYVALSLFTVENPEPRPPGRSNLWQLFVRRERQG